MADSFDFTDPLRGVDDLNEGQEFPEPELPPMVQEGNGDFDFNYPLKGVDLSSLPIVPRIAAEFGREVIAKPVAGVMAEADKKYPNSFFENALYMGDTIKGIALADNFKKMIAGFELSGQEEAAKIQRGDSPNAVMTPGLFGMPIIDSFQLKNKEQYLNDPEYKAKVDSEIGKVREESFQEFKKLNKQIAKKKNDAGLGDYGKSVSSAAESMAIIGTGMTANFLTRGQLTPAISGATIGYFGLQTAGASYTEARQEGLSHEAAMPYSIMQGGFESLTETIPVLRLFKPIDASSLKNIAKQGMITVGAEVGMENINTLLQEHNSVLFGLESELKTAYDNINNPLYEGPSVSDVLLDLAGHTTLSSFIAAGSVSSARGSVGAVYTPEVKNFIRSFKDNPALEEFVESFNTTINNMELNYQAIDRAAVTLLDPDYSGRGVLDEEVLAEEYLKTAFLRLDTPILIPDDYRFFQRPEEKFPEPEKPSFNFEDPLNLQVAERKMPGPMTSEIDLDLSPDLTEKTNRLNFLLERESTMITPTLDINTIQNDSYNQQEIDTTQRLIIDTRSFDERFLDENPDIDTFYRLRDLNPEESVNASKTVFDLNTAGMPIDIFTDLKFIGAHTKDNRYKTFESSYGVYMPTIEGVVFSPISGITNLNFDNSLGSKLQLRSTMAHEMGHHIDFSIGRNLNTSKNSLTPATADSPLFNMPTFKYNQDTNSLDVTDGTGGEVMREAFDLFNAADPGSYYSGGLLKYPFNQIMSLNNDMTPAMEMMFRAEVFGQLHDLYYTNRALLESKAPRSLQLIEEINDAISVDSITEKNKRVLLAFQSPRAQRGVEVQSRDRDRAEAGPSDQLPEANSRVVGPEGPEDGDGVRPAIPELRQVKTTGQVVGAPEGFDSKQKVGALRRKMKGLAEAGVSQRFWYEQSGQALLDITNNNKEDADKLAQVIAITSPGTPVDANFTYALQAYYQYQAGQPVKTGRFPVEMSKKVLSVFEGQDWGGRKTNEFYNNIMRVIDPTRTQGVTVDVWMARAFGFTNDAPTDAQYTFVQNEIQKISDQLGWEPQQVQAAIWTAQKARDEGTDVNAAGFNYQDAINKSLGQISWESIPGETSNHMPEMFNAPYEQVQEFHVAISKALQDEDGSDAIANALGILSPGIIEAPGFFDGRVSPGSQTEVALPKVYKAGKDEFATLEPAAEDAVKAYSAALGILLKQDGVGYHKPFVQKGIAKSKLNGMDIDIGRSLTEAETQAVAEAMERESGVKDYNPIGTSRGARLINFSYLNIPNVRFKSIVNKALDSVQFENNEDVVAGQFAANEGYLDNDWSTNKNGEGYIQSIRGISPDLQGRVSDIVRKLQSRIDEVDQSFSEKYGWTRDESINSEFRGTTELKDVPSLKQEIAEPEQFDIYETLTANDASSIFSAMSSFQELAVDKLDRLKEFEKRFGEKIPPNEMRRLSVIRKTDVYHGKVKYGMDKAVEETTALNEFLAENNISVEEFNTFLKNLHAPERNQKINEKYNKEIPELETRLLEATAEGDKKKQTTLKGQITKRKNVLAKYEDSGSGINTDAAIKKLESLGIKFNPKSLTATATNDAGKNLLKAFDILNAYQQETINIYKDQDLVDEETLEDWDASYKYYVPLVGFAVDTVEGDSPMSKGGGVSVFGREVMEAKGRTTESGPPLEQAVFRRQSAVVRGEKNYINKSLAEMVNKFPEKKIWQVRGVKRNERPHDWDGKEAKIAFKENGKQKFIVIRDQRLADGLTNWGNQSTGWFIGTFRGMTGALSSLYTSLAPEFVVGNFFRDYQTGYFNILKEQEMLGGRAEGMDLARAFNPKNIAKTMRQLKDGYVTGKLKEKDPEAFALFDAFQKFGGQTGYVNAKDIDQISKDMEILSANYSGKKTTDAKKAFKSAFRIVENVNNAVENTARFAAFKEYINAKGGPKKATKEDYEDAAVLAKNLTINFNRSGKLGPIVNAFYVFANASVQGSVNLFRGMNPVGFQDGKLKWTGMTSASKKIVGGLAGLGALVEMYSMLVSDEDEDGRLLIDKIPAHEKERFMIIPIPGVKYKDGNVKFNKFSRRYTVDGKPFAIAMPLPYGYNIFYNMGRMGVEMASKPIVGYERRSPLEFGIDISGIAAGSFSPVGIGYSQDQGFDFVKTAVPSVAKPLYESRVNEKWTGAPVYKEQFPMSAPRAQSGMKLKNTNEFYREFTMMVNRASGGGKFDPGMLDWSPDKIKFYLQSYLGGMYTMAERTGAISGKIYDNLTVGTNQDITLNEIPFVRVLTAEPQDYVDAGRFYENKELIKTVAGEFMNYTKQAKRSELKEYVKRTDFNREYLKMNALLKKADSELLKLSKKEKTILKLRDSNYVRYIKLSDEIDEKRNEIHQMFNRKFDKSFRKIERKKESRD